MISTPSTQSWGNLELSEAANLSNKFSLVSLVAGLSPCPGPMRMVGAIDSAPAGAEDRRHQAWHNQLSQNQLSLTKVVSGESSPPLLPPPPAGLAANHCP